MNYFKELIEREKQNTLQLKSQIHVLNDTILQLNFEKNQLQQEKQLIIEG